MERTRQRCVTSFVDFLRLITRSVYSFVSDVPKTKTKTQRGRNFWLKNLRPMRHLWLPWSCRDSDESWSNFVSKRRAFPSTSPSVVWWRCVERCCRSPLCAPGDWFCSGSFSFAPLKKQRRSEEKRRLESSFTFDDERFDFVARNLHSLFDRFERHFLLIFRDLKKR